MIKVRKYQTTIHLTAKSTFKIESLLAPQGGLYLTPPRDTQSNPSHPNPLIAPRCCIHLRWHFKKSKTLKILISDFELETWNSFFLLLDWMKAFSCKCLKLWLPCLKKTIYLFFSGISDVLPPDFWKPSKFWHLTLWSLALTPTKHIFIHFARKCGKLNILEKSLFCQQFTFW